MKKITFDDIVGYDFEKEEAKKIVEILKNYSFLVQNGAYLPKGLLLTGDPGVGKTMFAKAIANEAQVKFINTNLSSVFNVQDTIKSLMDCFTEAKKNAPSVLFLDEIDQLIGYRRFSDSDERHRLIDFLLQNMDGEDSTEGVFIIATCNDYDSLPEAFFRSGRIDRIIQLDKPNYEYRVKLLEYYTQKNEKLSHLNIKKLAKGSEGLTCSDFKAILNSILLECLLEDRYAKDEEFYDKVRTIVKKDINREKKGPYSLVTCVHELGHYAVGYHFGRKRAEINIKEADSGTTSFASDEDTGRIDPDFTYCMHTITIALAGKAAEEIFLQKTSTGCYRDLRHAMEYLDHLMETGGFGFDYLSGDAFSSHRLGDKKMEEAHHQLKICYEEAKTILLEEKNLVEYLKPILLKKGKITYDESEKLIQEYETKDPLLVREENKGTEKRI